MVQRKTCYTRCTSHPYPDVSEVWPHNPYKMHSLFNPMSIFSCMYCLPSNILSPRNTKRGKNIKKKTALSSQSLYSIRTKRKKREWQKKTPVVTCKAREENQGLLKKRQTLQTPPVSLHSYPNTCPLVRAAWHHYTVDTPALPCKITKITYSVCLLFLFYYNVISPREIYLSSFVFQTPRTFVISDTKQEVNIDYWKN